MNQHIAIIVWDLSVSGGTQRQALELAQQLLRMGASVDVYTHHLDRKLCYPSLLRGLRILEIDSSADRRAKGWRIFKLPIVGARLKRFLDELYFSYRSHDVQIKELAHKMIETDYDIVNAHDSPAHKVAVKYKLRHPNSSVVWMSNDMPWIFQVFDKGGMPRRKHLPFKFPRAVLLMLERGREVKVIKNVDLVIVLDLRNQRLFKHYVGVRPKVIHSGLDQEKFKPKLKKSNKIFTVLATGIFFRYRRFEDLITATGLVVKHGVSLRLNIVGSNQFDPAYGQELESLVKKLGLSSTVNFLGRVEEGELLKQYRDADVFVFPNHNQTWGLAVFEAMASGTPVIVSRTAGAHEVLSDGENALFVNPLQPSDIADKLLMLYNNQMLRHKTAKNGVAFVRKNISWQQYADQMVKAFKDVVKKRSNRV